jgi:hypothetical protein
VASQHFAGADHGRGLRLMTRGKADDPPSKERVDVIGNDAFINLSSS